MKELAKYWAKFYSDMCEINPNCTDADFNFSNFMDWYTHLPGRSEQSTS